MLTLSVVIPTINEAKTLPLLLDQLGEQEGLLLDIVVVDGGSKDETLSFARAAGATIVESEKGRARQLNAGAQVAKHPYLLFLHADSSLPDNQFLARALTLFVEKNNPTLAGHFALTFIREQKQNTLAFRFMAEKTATNRPQTINGDQGLLISRDFFETLGGYDETVVLMEDQVIAARIFSEGEWLLLPGKLATSGRRFEREGFHRRYILMSLMMGLYWTGAHEFFNRAKAVYPDQNKTQRLLLWPFFRTIWQMLIRDFGWRRSAVQWYKVGSYVRRNSWQLFFFFDVLLRGQLGPDTYPFTRFHDRVFFPLTNNVLCNVLITPVVFIWTMFVLGPVFYCLDHGSDS